MKNDAIDDRKHTGKVRQFLYRFETAPVTTYKRLYLIKNHGTPFVDVPCQFACFIQVF